MANMVLFIISDVKKQVLFCTWLL